MSGAPLRLLGLTLDASAGNPGGKNGGLYAALAARYPLVGMVRPALSRAEDTVLKLLHAHPDRARWRHRYNTSPLTFRRRSAEAERQLRTWDGRFDLIVQLHTLLAPGEVGRRRYVLHTDNTYALSERHYPPWAPLGGRARTAWMDQERRVYQGAERLYPRSEWLRRSLIDDYGCDPARVIRTGGGANLRAASLDGKRWDRPVALFVGLQFERKGGRVLLDAWAQVHRRRPDARLQIVGETPAGRAPPGVEYLGRVDDRAALARLYQDAALFVMPSLFEPWGHVFYEAMGYGLPCVGTACCAMAEIIEPGVTGLLVPPGQPGPLAEALLTLLDHPERAGEMGRAAHAGVARGHTWADVVERMGLDAL